MDFCGDGKCDPHLYHQENDRRTPVTYERKRYSGCRDYIENDADIEYDLQRDMYEYTGSDQRSLFIRRILCDHDQSVQKISEKNNNEQGSEKPQFFTDYLKDFLKL